VLVRSRSLEKKTPEAGDEAEEEDGG
jgi:hypothetical protein